MRLTVYETEQIDDLVIKKIPSNLTKNSSILEVFVDFTQIPPMIIDEHCLAVQIREVMKNEHVRMKIVVDANNHFKGILPLSCLTEEKVNRKIASDDFSYDNLFVKHCMIEKSKLQALDYNEITHATIGDVIESLKFIGHQYCLVIDHSNHQIRGVISANDISRALNMELNITGTGSSFIDVFDAIPHAL